MGASTDHSNGQCSQYHDFKCGMFQYPFQNNCRSRRIKLGQPPNQGTVNAVLFRTDKFDLLEEGHYFLCTDPSKSLISWDNSSGNKRFAVWAKLRVKETGELFYYFITHLDHLGSDARNEGTRINIEKVP